jgi:hypothetical protein
VKEQVGAIGADQLEIEMAIAPRERHEQRPVPQPNSTTRPRRGMKCAKRCTHRAASARHDTCREQVIDDPVVAPRLQVSGIGGELGIAELLEVDGLQALRCTPYKK